MPLKDLLFKLVPVEDETADNKPDESSSMFEQNQIALPIIQSQVQYNEATQPVTAMQADTPEDATASNSVDKAWFENEIATRDKQIADISAKLDQLIKYGASSSSSALESEPASTATITPDAPPDYVPLRELDFVTRDGKF